MVTHSTLIRLHVCLLEAFPGPPSPQGAHIWRASVFPNFFGTWPLWNEGSGWSLHPSAPSPVAPTPALPLSLVWGLGCRWLLFGRSRAVAVPPPPPISPPTYTTDSLGMLPLCPRPRHAAAVVKGRYAGGCLPSVFKVDFHSGL